MKFNHFLNKNIASITPPAIAIHIRNEPSSNPEAVSNNDYPISVTDSTAFPAKSNTPSKADVIGFTTCYNG